MAAVYRGRDLRLNREVAIKVLHDDLTRDAEFLQRFEREAQYVASLSHPNIVPVYDVGEERGSHFIVMEYIRGRTLRDAIESSGPLTAERAVEVLCAVLEALGYAHERGLIHRDVKPHNILLTRDGIARLADFGIAHLSGGSTTRTAAILGSANYLSPEQARGEEATAASDIYACGIVLYEALAGQAPFSGNNALAVAHHHLHSAAPPLPESHGPLEVVLQCALAKNPEDRYGSAAEMAAALRDALADGAPTARLLPAGDTTEALVPVKHHRTLPVAPPLHSEFVLRRSPRKTGVLALLCVVLLAIAAYLAPLSVNGRTLPSYPSAPYGLVPAIIAAALLLSWLHVRSWRYRMDGDAAVLQWGLLSHHRFGVPVRSITTLELKQSPIDRVLGLGTVELCARDQHGDERRLVLLDLPRPRQTYEELMRFVGRVVRIPTLPEDND